MLEDKELKRLVDEAFPFLPVDIYPISGSFNNNQALRREGYKAALQSLPVSDAVEFITWVHKYYGYDYKKEVWFSLDDLLGEEPLTHGELYSEFKLSVSNINDPENK